MAESIDQDMDGGAVDVVPQYYRAPNGHFCMQRKDGEWELRPSHDFKMRLARDGLSTTAFEGQKMSELDERYLDVSLENGVDYANIIAGWKPGYYERDGTRYLITREIQPITAVSADKFISAEESCPNIMKLVEAVFDGVDEDYDDPDVPQSALFMAWWRHAWRNLRDNIPVNGLALVLAGDAGCGKTLMKEFIRASFGGREAQPYRWFTGQEQFNGNLMKSPLWTVDDEQADTGFKARNHFGAKLKLCVANAGVPFRAMQTDELTLYPFRRIVVCVNREPERLMVLPPLVNDVIDKMLIMKCYSNDICRELAQKTQDEKDTFFNRIIKELPYFLYWIDAVWQPPENMNTSGRFGVQHFCHEELYQELFTLSPNQRLWDIIRKFVTDELDGSFDEYWEGGAKKMHSGMKAEDSCLSKSEQDDVPAWNWLGSKLKELMKQYPEAISFRRGGKTNVWRINLKNYLEEDDA